MLGTSFWPDVEITQDGVRLIAIEVKLIRPGDRASGALAQTIGQAVIYSFAYPKVFAFVAHYGAYDARCDEYDQELQDRLLPLNVEMIMRRPGSR